MLALAAFAGGVAVGVMFKDKIMALLAKVGLGGSTPPEA